MYNTRKNKNVEYAPIQFITGPEALEESEEENEESEEENEENLESEEE